MKRLLPLLALLALPATGCSLGQALRGTYITDRSATFNGSVFSTENAGVTYADDHSVDYWFRYGTTQDYGSETVHRTLQLAPHAFQEPFPVSVPVLTLEPSTTYHYTLCADDAQPDVPPSCAGDQTVTTSSEAGRSGIAFKDASGYLYRVDADGGNLIRLTDETDSNGSDADPAWSPDAGSLAFWSADDQGEADLWVTDADGSAETRLTDDPEFEEDPAWSPDGARIAFDDFQDVYVIGSEGGERTRLTADPAPDFQPTWSPDGTRIAFIATRNGNSEVYVMDADGSDERRLTNEPGGSLDPAWSPDGTQIAFSHSDGDGDGIYVIDANGGDDPTRLTVGGFQPTWSPDGSRIAFADFSSDACRINVVDVDGSNQDQLCVGLNGISDLAWSHRPSD